MGDQTASLHGDLHYMVMHGNYSRVVRLRANNIYKLLSMAYGCGEGEVCQMDAHHLHGELTYIEQFYAICQTWTCYIPSGERFKCCIMSSP